jgi:purine-nucleoside phosphorylase
MLTLVKPKPAISARESLAAQAAEAVRSRWSRQAEVAIILGTGLGDLAGEMDADVAIPYRELPNFPRSTALAHKGQLVCGSLAGVPTLAMQGRSHLYEGYRFDDLMLPVRMLCALGVKVLIVSNAAGGVNPRYAVGDVMLIDDHINLMGRPDIAALPAGSHPPIAAARRGFYDEQLLQTALSVARKADFPCHQGVYVGVTGPSYETRAEYRLFRRIGGDCVGMSTIPEVHAANECGLRVLAISTVTNVARPDAPQVVSAEDVVHVAQEVQPKVRQIVLGILDSL